ncbi:MAG: N-methyl-L-tryptophan oxidase [Caldilineaceae bacterium]|nr:N-methyl-L-tryptophan oxidase [Caldilineaceae bacterium]
MQQDYDVIVVGLGAMGSAALYQLARRGARVLGIDQFRPPHTLGSSHGESRITRLSTGEGAAYVPLAQRSHALWRELEAESGTTLLTLSGGLIISPRQESAYFHGQGDFVAQTAAIANQFALAHEVWPADTVRQRWPQLRMNDHEHAYYEPTGGLVAVEEAVATQLRLAKQRGAVVRFDERVLGYQPDNDNGQSVTVTTKEGHYRAAKVILTAGSWLPGLLGRSLAKPMAVYRQVIYWFEVEDPAQFQSDHFPFVIWIGDRQEEFFTIFPYTAAGTVGAKVLTEEYLQTVTPFTVDRTVHAQEVERMYHDFVAKRVSGILPRCLKTGVCLYTNTLDEHFLIDFHPEHQPVIVASPCSGHGFKHSAAVGESLAELALEGKSTLDLSPFTFQRFLQN